MQDRHAPIQGGDWHSHSASLCHGSLRETAKIFNLYNAITSAQVSELWKLPVVLTSLFLPYASCLQLALPHALASQSWSHVTLQLDLCQYPFCTLQLPLLHWSRNCLLLCPTSSIFNYHALDCHNPYILILELYSSLSKHSPSTACCYCNMAGLPDDRK